SAGSFRIWQYSSRGRRRVLPVDGTPHAEWDWIFSRNLDAARSDLLRAGRTAFSSFRWVRQRQKLHVGLSMLGTKTLVLFTVATLCAASDFDGARALEWTQKAVALGPRPAGSPAIQKLQAMIRTELKANGWAISEDAFTADTPVGK